MTREGAVMDQEGGSLGSKFYNLQIIKDKKEEHPPGW